MKLTEQEEKYVAKLRRTLARHNVTRWVNVVVCALGGAAIIWGANRVQVLLERMLDFPGADQMGLQMWNMAFTIMYPKLMIMAMGVGAFFGYTITHWRPDPAKSLLVKIVETLERNGEQSPAGDRLKAPPEE